MTQSFKTKSNIFAYVIVLCALVAPVCTLAAAKVPQELLDGMLIYEQESGNYLRALTLMDEQSRSDKPIAHASALLGFNMHSSASALLESLPLTTMELTSQELFVLGRYEYFSGNYKPALKIFKKLKNKLPLDAKQEWAFYRANSLIKINRSDYAAQALNDFPAGLWAAHGYYNLAIAYNGESANKDKAITALRVAGSLNGDETREEKELNSRINFAAGAIALEAGEPKKAIGFFNKVYLDSYIAPQALYLTGVAHLELRNFRDAIQFWNKVKKYHVIVPGVPESLLAEPFAYERQGYIAQALEVYLEASTFFEAELKNIRKIQDAIKKYGVFDTLIEPKDIKGLEWFLAKDVAKNELKNTYYEYLMQDAEIYDSVVLISELNLLRNTLDYWADQLKAFGNSLSRKSKNFTLNSKKFKPKNYLDKASAALKKLQSIPTSNELSSQVKEDVASLKARISFIEQRISLGRKQLDNQLKQGKQFRKKITGLTKRLDKLVRKLDSSITTAMVKELDVLYDQMVLNFEQSDQGLVNLFESVALEEKSKSSRLDRRFQ